MPFAYSFRCACGKPKAEGEGETWYTYTTESRPFFSVQVWTEKLAIKEGFDSVCSECVTKALTEWTIREPKQLS